MSYLQSTTINNTHSVFQILFSGVPHGSILGPSILINGLVQNVDTIYVLTEAEDLKLY